MITRKELLSSKEYWLEKIQNELYHYLVNYMNEKKINQTQLAKELNVTKGYISQVLNGNFNHSIKKLIELSLAINKVPLVEFYDLKEYLKKDNQKRELYKIQAKNQKKNRNLQGKINREENLVEMDLY